jgi:hypothetical protein
MITELLRRLERRVDRWSVESQQHARRNALVANTALAKRRAEREDVEDFFAALLAAPATAVGRASRAGEVRAAR